MLSEKVAVIVTTSEFETMLSESVSVRVTVGGFFSKRFIVIELESEFPAASVKL
jgi:hypothetical protein